MRAERIEPIDGLLQRVAEGRFGARARRLGELARAVKALSDRYNRREAARIDDEAQLMARLLFFTPADLPKVGYALGELGGAGLLPVGPLRVLDVGAGCGAQTLGLVARLGDLSMPRSLCVDAIDRDRSALSLMSELLSGIDPAVFGARIEYRVEVADVTRIAPPRPPYDLIVVGTTLAELPEAEHLKLIERLMAALGEAGALIIIEPALKTTARALAALRDRILAGGVASVFAPCTHQRPCPMLAGSRDWCHERRRLEPSRRLRQVAAMTGLRRRDLSWSYLTLRNGPENVSVRLGGSPSRRVVSSVRRSKGRRQVLVCGGQGLSELIFFDRHAGVTKRIFSGLSRGELIALDPDPAGARLTLAPETRIDVLDPAEPPFCDGP